VPYRLSRHLDTTRNQGYELALFGQEETAVWLLPGLSFLAILLLVSFLRGMKRAEEARVRKGIETMQVARRILGPDAPQWLDGNLTALRQVAAHPDGYEIKEWLSYLDGWEAALKAGDTVKAEACRRSIVKWFVDRGYGLWGKE